MDVKLRQVCSAVSVGIILVCTATAVLTVTPPARKPRNALEHIKYWYRLRKVCV